MRPIRCVIALTLVFVFAAGILADEEGKKKGKGKDRKGDQSMGVVTAVNKESISVRLMMRGEKKGAPASGPEKKFRITKETRIAKMSGPKGKTDSTAAKLEDIRPGSRVMIVAKSGSDVAEQIRIADRAKGDKKKKEKDN